MASYDLEFTDITVPAIGVDENTVNNVAIDITLFGFEKLNYGRELNENFVHILENFAVPQNQSSPSNPDLTKISYRGESGSNALLANNKPIEGQIWYNSTQTRPFIRHTGKWNPLENFGQDVAANWGQIADGQQIPRPVSESGYVFTYEECSWTVSPFNQVEELVDMVCRTDEDANVIMEYLYEGDVSKTSGIANYMIVGLRDNNNSGVLVSPEPQPSQTPTPSPSSSQGAAPSPTPTPTPTPTPSGEVVTSPLSITMFQPYEATCSGTCMASEFITQGPDYVVSGGSGNRTYQWEYVSGVFFEITNPTSSSTAIRRLEPEGSSNVSGTGKLTVTDTTTGEVKVAFFNFVTNHTLVDITNTPTPTPTPTPSSSITPTPTPTPTNTPTPTPSNSAAAPVTLESGSDALSASQSCSGGVGSIGASETLTTNSGQGPFTFTITSFVVDFTNGPISNGPGASLGSIDPNNGTANLTVSYEYSDGSVGSQSGGEVTVEVADDNGTTDTKTFTWSLSKCFGF